MANLILNTLILVLYGLALSSDTDKCLSKDGVDFSKKFENILLTGLAIQVIDTVNTNVVAFILCHALAILITSDSLYKCVYWTVTILSGM